MSVNGVYGTNVGANISTEDVEIFYSYSPTRNSDDNSASFKQLPAALLKQATIDETTLEDSSRNGVKLEGLYNINLPLQYFNKKGYYTIYIKPREIPVVIQDVGVLSSFADVKGIVIDKTQVTDGQLKGLLNTNNSLVGYRVKYMNQEGEDENYYRIVTSSNKVEPVVQNITDVNSKSVRYRFNESSALVFLTVSPSVAPSFKANAAPYIGTTSQRISLVNTKFEPVMIDLEMVENDCDTIATMINGSQIRDLDNGLVTTFNKNNEIFAQHEHYTLKENGTPVYEVKVNKSNSIDFSQTLEDKL